MMAYVVTDGSSADCVVEISAGGSCQKASVGFFLGSCGSCRASLVSCETISVGILLSCFDDMLWNGSNAYDDRWRELEVNLTIAAFGIGVQTSELVM